MVACLWRLDSATMIFGAVLPLDLDMRIPLHCCANHRRNHLSNNHRSVLAQPKLQSAMLFCVDMLATPRNTQAPARVSQRTQLTALPATRGSIVQEAPGRTGTPSVWMMCGRRLAGPSTGVASALSALLEAVALHADRLLPAVPSRSFAVEPRRVPQFCCTTMFIRLLHALVAKHR